MAFISAGGLVAFRSSLADPFGDLRSAQRDLCTHVASISPAKRALYGAVVLAVIAAAIAAVLLGGAPDALKASSLGGKAVDGLADWADGVKANLLWFAGVAAAIGIVVIGILFVSAHSRAHDYAIRFAIGCAILAGGTGLVA